MPRGRQWVGWVIAIVLLIVMLVSVALLLSGRADGAAALAGALGAGLVASFARGRTTAQLEQAGQEVESSGEEQLQHLQEVGKELDHADEVIEETVTEMEDALARVGDLSDERKLALIRAIEEK